MASLNIINQAPETIYVYPSVRPGYKIIDYAIDIAGLLDGFTEVKEALVGTEELEKLPEAIETFEDFIKFAKYIWNAKKKLSEFTEKAKEAIEKVYHEIMGMAIEVPQSDKPKEIMTEDALGHLNPAGVAELLGARVVNVSFTSHTMGMVQVQSSVATTWTVQRKLVSQFVQEAGSTHLYLFHVSESFNFNSTTPSPVTDWHPAMTVDRYDTYLLAKGIGNTMWWSRFKGGSWSIPMHIPGMHPEKGVAVTAEFRVLKALWKDPDSNSLLYSTFNAQEADSNNAHAQWSKPQKLGVDIAKQSIIQTQHVPAISAMNSDMSIAVLLGPMVQYYKAFGSPDRLQAAQVQSLTAGAISPALVTGHIRTGVSSSSAVTCCAWVGLLDKCIYVSAHSNDSKYRVAPVLLSKDAWTNGTPALVFTQKFYKLKQFYVFFRGHKKQGIYYYEFDILNGKISKGKKKSIPKTKTNAGPTAVFADQKIKVAYKDPVVNHVVWITEYNFKKWSEPRMIG